MVEHSRTQDCLEGGLPQQNSFGNVPRDGKHTQLYERSSPITPGKGSGPSHSDATFFKTSSTSSSLDNEVGSGTATKCVHYNICCLCCCLLSSRSSVLLCQNKWLVSSSILSPKSHLEGLSILPPYWPYLLNHLQLLFGKTITFKWFKQQLWAIK